MTVFKSSMAFIVATSLTRVGTILEAFTWTMFKINVSLSERQDDKELCVILGFGKCRTQLKNFLVYFTSYDNSPINCSYHFLL